MDKINEILEFAHNPFVRLFKDGDFDCDFIPNDWNTEQTYSGNFKSTPNSSGVYLIVYTAIIPDESDKAKIVHKVLYVGSSSNLKRRYGGHEILKAARYFLGDSVRFYFRETNDYKSIEKSLIEKFQPPLNIAWRA